MAADAEKSGGKRKSPKKKKKKEEDKEDKSPEIQPARVKTKTSEDPQPAPKLETETARKPVAADRSKELARAEQEQGQTDAHKSRKRQRSPSARERSTKKQPRRGRSERRSKSADPKGQDRSPKADRDNRRRGATKDGRSSHKQGGDGLRSCSRRKEPRCNADERDRAANRNGKSQRQDSRSQKRSRSRSQKQKRRRSRSPDKRRRSRSRDRQPRRESQRERDKQEVQREPEHREQEHREQERREQEHAAPVQPERKDIARATTPPASESHAAPPSVGDVKHVDQRLPAPEPHAPRQEARSDGSNRRDNSHSKQEHASQERQWQEPWWARGKERIGDKGGQKGKGRGKGIKSGPGREFAISKALCRILRHQAGQLGLKVRADGHCLISDLLQLQEFQGVTQQDIIEVVQSNDKKRFDLGQSEQGGLMVRCVQGHSLQEVDDDALLVRITAKDVPNLCVHGTYFRNVDAIKEKGLLVGGGMSGRKHIHFAPYEPGDGRIISGMRYDCEVAIYVDIRAAMDDGHVFYRSANDVILTAGKGGQLPPKFISKMKDLRKGEDIELPNVQRAAPPPPPPPAPQQEQGVHVAACASTGMPVHQSSLGPVPSWQVNQHIAQRAPAPWMAGVPQVASPGSMWGVVAAQQQAQLQSLQSQPPAQHQVQPAQWVQGGGLYLPNLPMQMN